jgi:hypothetical protein
MSAKSTTQRFVTMGLAAALAVGLVSSLAGTAHANGHYGHPHYGHPNYGYRSYGYSVPVYTTPVYVDGGATPTYDYAVPTYSPQTRVYYGGRPSHRHAGNSQSDLGVGPVTDLKRQFPKAAR